MKFKVLQGVHVQDGKSYGPGKIVTSGSDLAKIFVNKFEAIPDPVVKEAAKETEAVTETKTAPAAAPATRTRARS